MQQNPLASGPLWRAESFLRLGVPAQYSRQPSTYCFTHSCPRNLRKHTFGVSPLLWVECSGLSSYALGDTCVNRPRLRKARLRALELHLQKLRETTNFRSCLHFS